MWLAGSSGLPWSSSGRVASGEVLWLVGICRAEFLQKIWVEKHMSVAVGKPGLFIEPSMLGTRWLSLVAARLMEGLERTWLAERVIKAGLCMG